VLTKRQLEILRDMIAADRMGDYDDSEIVREGRSCWLGCVRVSPGHVDALLAYAAVTLSSEPGAALERYVVTGTGRRIADDPSVASKVMAALLSGGSFDAGGDPI